MHAVLFTIIVSFGKSNMSDEVQVMLSDQQLPINHSDL
jgi:hypothetical protein